VFSYLSGKPLKLLPPDVIFKAKCTELDLGWGSAQTVLREHTARSHDLNKWAKKERGWKQEMGKAGWGKEEGDWKAKGKVEGLLLLYQLAERDTAHTTKL